MSAEDHFFLASQRWLQRSEVSSLAVVCTTEAHQPIGIRRRPALEVPGCLQELPLHRLVDLSLAGVKGVELASSSCCGESALTALTERWRTQLGDLMSLTVAVAPPAQNWTWSLSPGRVPMDRRGLLGLSQRSSPPWPIHEPDADDESRLVASLRIAGITTIDARPPGLELFASGCTACGVCVTACPHDALTLLVDGTETQLVHSPEACQGEQQCVALCPVEALTVVGPLTWPTVLEGTPHVLATLQMAVCERCKARFPARSGQRWCETCRIRRSDPFGSHLPEAAIKLLKARGHDRPL